MKNKYVIIYPVASVVLFVIGYFSYPFVEQLIHVLLNNIPIVPMESSTPIKLTYLFATTLAAIPLLTALTNFLFQMKGKYNYFVYLAMFFSILIFGGIRIYNVNQYYVEEQRKFGEHIRLQFPMENLQIVSFMFVGAMVGCIVGALFLNRIQKKATKLKTK